MMIPITIQSKGQLAKLVIFLALVVLPLQRATVKDSAVFAFASQSCTSTHRTNIIDESDVIESAESTTVATGTGNRKTYKLIQVQVIHRHGDRTPITPMKDEKYWSDTLPPPSLLSKIAEGTTIKRNEDEEGKVHGASGRGPFGKLTQLGLLQMVEVGSRLREELHLDEDDAGSSDGGFHIDDEGHIHLHKGRLFTGASPLHPTKIKVKSTDFPRTLQSVQALLVGLFPDGLPEGVDVEIDARHTSSLIPDPQPRSSQEQVQLERALSRRQHIVDKEEELKDLAKKISRELKPFVGKDANSAVFGIGEEDDAKQKERALTWSQLSEIMTCLKARDMLPESISLEEYETVTSHSAWKWFENLRHSRLAFLAMKPFMNFIMETLNIGKNQNDGTEGNEKESILHIYSAHDSSLIGLMCAFRLQQPSKWPEYGSYLKIELFEAEPVLTIDNLSQDGFKDYFVRFSLNGSVLNSHWGPDKEGHSVSNGMIPLRHLENCIEREHGE